MGTNAGPKRSMVYDSSATTSPASVASGVTSVARSDYAGNAFTDTPFPGDAVTPPTCTNSRSP